MLYEIVDKNDTTGPKWSVHVNPMTELVSASDLSYKA